MEINKKSSMPSEESAFLTSLVAYSIFIIGSIVVEISEISLLGIITMSICYLLITISCFFILKKNPRSIWYVPLICNAPIVLHAVIGNVNTKDSDWTIIYIGLLLSAIASIIGALLGKRSTISDSSQKPNS